ncbi:anti-sigma factor family protein [Desulfosporosinus meridiei]|uniref:Zinc-finger domain-containing protein n=1 Tax=Desulfosporosinus meridiei (strain ATCC BAA-275 / DSM 13257 / KCTC 12902 / NCIMB 13706 / S10) TaxID=768704 RepID=J7IW04_DESMD|nr:zf-HC2 domain-containing protein [Desulfosporosinus meridiei]AFQ42881.1 hypothetical protein Desmer_0849 [Desulfosporosinus meridiei DSM 13257]
MTCYRSQDSWHSYVKQCLSDSERNEMASHLGHCPECREIVSDIKKTLEIISNPDIPMPQLGIKVNVMDSIDKSRYKQNLVSVNTFRLFELRNWGFSMIAAGVFLFAFNLTSFSSIIKTDQVTELGSSLSKQISIPLDKVSQAASSFLNHLIPNSRTN